MADTPPRPHIRTALAKLYEVVRILERSRGLTAWEAALLMGQIAAMLVAIHERMQEGSPQKAS
jgi:hypothetical protein